MASLRLNRKALRNRVKSKMRTDSIQSLQYKPVLKKYTREELIARFNTTETAAPAQVEEAVAEKKPVAKKAKAEATTEAKPKAKAKAEVKAEAKPKAKKATKKTENKEEK